ncbi:unnamed protein product, partial [Mesorhabditis spiculigera]
MEPAVTSQGSTNNGFRVEKGRRNANEYLNIDPSSAFISGSSGIDDGFPDNFLETISPQQVIPSFLQATAPLPAMLHGDTATSSPQLAPLAPMTIGTDQSFRDGPAGLLSPLHMDGRRHSVGANEYSRGVYIKEEADIEPSHHLMLPSNQVIGHNQADLDRANAATPPALSTAELASNMISSIIGDPHLQGGDSPVHHYTSVPSGSMVLSRLTAMKTVNPFPLNVVDAHHDDDGLEGPHTNGDHVINGESTVYKPAYNKGKRTYSTKDANDPLNAEIDDDIYIDTKELCKRIAYELKQHSIPQAIFAERILCRSQGTLSDLLRNPKPWNKLKSGRETFRRMFNWVRQGLEDRLAILDMVKDGENGAAKMGMSPPTPAQNVRHHTRARNSGLGDGEPSNKRPRLVFTDIQKRTLQAIFRETQRPSREMQQTIAEHLRLDLSTVANFFMNARRRSRIGPGNDEPAPYQQVRPITPPPDSPPRVPPAATIPNRNRNSRPSASSAALIEQTVNGVADGTYPCSSRKLDEELAASSLQHMHQMGAVGYKSSEKSSEQLNGGPSSEEGRVIVDGEVDGSGVGQRLFLINRYQADAEEPGAQPDHDVQPPLVTYTVPDTPGDDSTATPASAPAPPSAPPVTPERTATSVADVKTEAESAKSGDD